MILWKRAAVLGLLSWLIPFALSFFLFPMQKPNAPLFETLRDLILLLTGGALLRVYFLHPPVALCEAVFVGALWVGIDLPFDYPMFAFGPMKMTMLADYSELGLGYLAFPALAFAAARPAQP